MPHTNEKVMVEQDVSVYRCDWCGKVIEFHFFHPRACLICKRFACEGHRAPWHIAYVGDYEESHCGECWETGLCYREEIEMHEIAIESLNDQWICEAKMIAMGFNKVEE